MGIAAQHVAAVPRGGHHDGRGRRARLLGRGGARAQWVGRAAARDGCAGGGRCACRPIGRVIRGDRDPPR